MFDRLDRGEATAGFAGDLKYCFDVGFVEDLDDGAVWFRGDGRTGDEFDFIADRFGCYAFDVDLECPLYSPELVKQITQIAAMQRVFRFARIATSSHSASMSERICVDIKTVVPFSRKSGDQFAYLAAADRVEPAHRFVEKNDFGVVYQRLGEADTLQHSF